MIHPGIRSAFLLACRRVEAWNRSSSSLWIILLTGLIARLGWLYKQPLESRLSIGEAQNVAYAFATTGTIADSFRVGQGPTAHVMPISPMIAGSAYRLLGYQTPLADVALTLWSISLVFVSFIFIDKVFAVLGTRLLPRRIALCILCIVPLNFSLEVVWFRVWEGALAVALAAVYLYILVSRHNKPVTRVDIVVVSFLLAVLCFVQPSTGLAAAIATVVFMVNNIERRRWLSTMALSALCGAFVFTPWVVRNMVELHQPVLLRSNAGLEMALAFHAGAAGHGDPRTIFFQRHKQIHPFEHGPGFAAMQLAGGEVAYSNSLGKRALSWMSAHPMATTALSLRHLVEMFFPPKWYWTQFSEASTGTSFKLWANWAISAFGLLGVILMLRSKDPRRFYAPILLVISVIPYAFVQPTLRYRYLIIAMLVYFSMYSVSILLNEWRARFG